MTGPKPEDNYQQIEDLEEENHSLRQELTRVQTENDRLREEVKKLEKLLRSKARSATPFSKGQRKAHPKRPGRKPGQGPLPAPRSSTGGRRCQPGGSASDQHALPVLRGRVEMAADRPGDHHRHAGFSPNRK